MPKLLQFPTKLLIGFSDDHLNALDKWRRKQPDLPSRSEAVRRLVESGLPTKRTRPISDTARKEKAAQAEKAAHDHLDHVLKGHPEEVRSARKKQLTSMPGGLKRR